MTVLFGEGLRRGVPYSYLDDNWLQFITAGVLLAVIVAIIQYIRSYNCPMVARAPGADGESVHGFTTYNSI